MNIFIPNYNEAYVTIEKRVKHVNVTPSPKIVIFPMFWKNFLRRMLNPELRMIGGRSKSKNTFSLKA